MAKKIIILSLVLIFLIVIIGVWEKYSYGRFSWVRLESVLFKLELVWYNDELIFKTLDSQLEIAVSFHESGAIVLWITDYHSYLFSQYPMYYSITDKKWMNEKEWDCYIESISNESISYRTTQRLDLDDLSYDEYFRKMFNEALDYIETSRIYEREKYKKAPVLTL